MTHEERDARRADDMAREVTLDQLRRELSEAVDVARKYLAAGSDSVRELSDLKSRVATLDSEMAARIKETSERAADAYAKAQAAVEVASELRRHLSRPFMDAGATAEHDAKASEMLQFQLHLNRGLSKDTFVYEPEKAVPIPVYRNICRKMMMIGVQTPQEFRAKLSSAERTVYEATMLDSGFFVPQVLGMMEDCTTECAYLLDLYEQITVSRQTFSWPRVEDVGNLGDYHPVPACDFPDGQAGAVSTANGRTYDFRGTFCFDRAHLNEAQFDLLDFMIRTAQRSYRIKRDAALMTGDGIDRPLGWMSANCFPKEQFGTGNPTAKDIRQFLTMVPRKYGPVTAIMHPRMLAYIMSMTNADGLFLFQPGQMMVDIVDGQTRDGVRVSECLPDPTAGGTLGSTTAPFVGGSFLMAAGNWPMAYAAVTQMPLQFQQHIGRSSMACVVYQFMAKDGGFVKCCDAARILQVAP